MATPTNFSNFPPNRNQTTVSTGSATNTADLILPLNALQLISAPNTLPEMGTQMDARISSVYPIPTSQTQNTHLPLISENSEVRISNENPLQGLVKEREELAIGLRKSITSIQHLNHVIETLFVDNQKANEQYEVANRRYTELYLTHQNTRQEIETHAQCLKECDEHSQRLNAAIQAIERQIDQAETVMRNLGQQVKKLLDANVLFLICCNRENLAQSDLPPVLSIQPPHEEENQLRIGEQVAARDPQFIPVSFSQQNLEPSQNSQSLSLLIPLFLHSNNNSRPSEAQSRPSAVPSQGLDVVQDCSILIRETRRTLATMEELTFRKLNLAAQHHKIVENTGNLISSLTVLESDLNRIQLQEIELRKTLQIRREDVDRRKVFLNKQNTTLKTMNGVIEIFNQQLENLMTARSTSFLCGNRREIANRGVSEEQAQLAEYLLSDEDRHVPVPEISVDALYVPEQPVNNHSPRLRHNAHDIVLSAPSWEANQAQVRYFDDEKKQHN